MDEQLLTTKEVADYFQVTPLCVTQNFIKRGLKYIEISSKSYRYDKKDILEFKEKIKKQDVPYIKNDDFFNYKVNVIKTKKMV